jgi:hypothetical protein
MTKFKIISVAGLAIAGVAASLMIQHASHRKFLERDDLLRKQGEQLAALTAEHQRLSDLAAHAQDEQAVDHTAELAKLRREAEALKKQTNDLVLPMEKSRASRISRPAPNAELSPQEFQERMRHMWEARDAATAFLQYAGDHQQQFPSNLDQIASYLAKENRTMSGTDQFDILYQGSLDKLDGVPLGAVAVIRSQQTWQGTNGNMTRVYGLADGHSQVVASDDNFQSWEAQHVISPPSNASQSGQ